MDVAFDAVEFAAAGAQAAVVAPRSVVVVVVAAAEEVASGNIADMLAELAAALLEFAGKLQVLASF